MSQKLDALEQEGWFGTGPRAQRFWALLAVLFGIIGFVKGLRLPNYWSASQAQVDYRFGLVKRGLFGAALSRPLHLEHYGRFAVVSFALLAVTTLLFVVYVLKSRIFTAIGQGEAVALFMTSFAIPCVVNLIGYFDIVLFGMTLALLLVRSTLTRFLLAIPVSVVALLLHESYLMLFAPVVLFSFLLDGTGARSSRQASWVYAATLGSVCLLTTLALAHGASLSPAKTDVLMQQIASQSNFPIRGDFFLVMQRSFGDNLRLMGHKLFEPFQLEEQVAGIIVFLPLLVMLFVYIRHVCSQSHNAWITKYGFKASVCVAFAPLCMQVLGWDVFRWDAWCCVAAFLALTLLVRAQSLSHLSVSPRLRNVTLLVMLLAVGTGEGLLDVAPNHYPFLREFGSTLRRIHHKGLVPINTM